MPLYKADVAFPVLVRTDNKIKAKNIVLKNALEEINNLYESDDFVVVNITKIDSLHEIPPKWKECIPWTDNDAHNPNNLTCVQLVEPFIAIVCNKCKSHSKIYTCRPCNKSFCAPCTVAHACKGE